MGKTSRSRANIKNNSRVQNPIQKQTPFVDAIVPVSQVPDSKFLSNAERHRNAQKIGCVRKGTNFSQLRISHVPDAQKRWKHEAHFQPSLAQQARDSIQIPVDKYAKNTRFLATLRLPGKNRFIPRLFSRACGSYSQEVLEANFQRSIIANDVPTLWPGNCTSCFCNAKQLGRADSQRQRNKNRVVFRRLFIGQPEQGSTGKSNSIHSKSPTKSRLAIELQKVHSFSTKINRIPRNLLGPSAGIKMAPFKKVFSSRGQNTTYTGERNSSFAGNTKPSWSHKLCELSRTSRSTESQRASSFLQLPFENKFLSPLQSPQLCTLRTKMVDKEQQCSLSTTPSSSKSLSNDRCLRNGMGGSSRQPRTVWRLVSPRSRPSFQSERDARCTIRFERSMSLPGQFYDYASDRQQNCGVVSEERGWLKIPKYDAVDTGYIRSPRQLPYRSGSTSPARKIELRSRSVITRPTLSRMASPSGNNQDHLWQMGHTSHRPVSIPDSACCAALRESRPERCERRVSRRFQPTMAVSSRMGIPTAISGPESIISPEHGEGRIPDRGSNVGKSVLATRHQEQSPGSPVYHTPPSPSASGHVDGSPTPEDLRDEVADLEMWGWTSKLIEWTPEQKQLLKKGWRDSSLKTYQHAWRKWLQWCSDNKANYPYNPDAYQLARFLIDLFQKQKLKFSTILVYKSAICTLCNPDLSDRLSSHVVVKKALASISNQRPKQISKPPIWDVDILTDWLLSNNSGFDNLYQSSKRAATLLLLCSGRRVHDLTLLAVDDNHCSISGDTIIFWPKFGSKTDKTDVRQSGWRLNCNTQQSAIDPVYWVKRVIQMSAVRRAECNSNNLFITACGKPKPASRSVIAGWVKRLLEEAGIKASAGSVRPAVASKNWIANCPLDNILAQGNWRSQDTFKKYYCREIKPSEHQTNVVSAMFSPIAN